MMQIIENGKKSLGHFVRWVKTIPAFTILPLKVRKLCLTHCWVEQVILNAVFRTLKYTYASDQIVLQTGEEVKSSDITHSLISYGAKRIMGELTVNFKELQLDHKELIFIRLLLLFGSG